jgi:hypothetical protein
MKTCPSFHCNNKLDEDADHCGKCGLNLRLVPYEIKARDELLGLFNEEYSKDGTTINMFMLDDIIKNYGGFIAIKMFNKSLEVIDSLVKEQTPRLKPKGLYGLFWERLIELDKNSEGLIKMPMVFTKLCRSFSLKKIECKDILLMLRDFGLLEFKKRGLKIIK